jgi:uncharacterized protein YabN with tetrapyrrole methylase and pyrophosphatase domain
MEHRLEDYFDLISKWGIDRNITAEGGATVLAQMSKMMEEFAEFLVTWDSLNYTKYYELSEEQLEEHKAQLADDFGDMLVCLIQAMRLAGLTPGECLAKAWEDIRYRKGTMINGKFVKES